MALDQVTQSLQTVSNSIYRATDLVNNPDWKLLKNGSKLLSETCQLVCAVTVEGRVHAVFLAAFDSSIKPFAELWEKLIATLDGLKTLNRKILPMEWKVEGKTYWFNVEQTDEFKAKGSLDKGLAYLISNGFAWGTILEGVVNADKLNFGKSSQLWGRAVEYSGQYMGLCYLVAGVADFAKLAKEWQEDAANRPTSFNPFANADMRKALINTGKTVKGIFSAQGISGTPKQGLALSIAFLQTYDSYAKHPETLAASKKRVTSTAE